MMHIPCLKSKLAAKDPNGRENVFKNGYGYLFWTALNGNTYN